MRKEGLWKKGLAASLVCAMTLSVFALSGGRTYAAGAIDLTKDCTLTVEVSAGEQYAEDLRNMTIPVKLYKVADVDVAGNYTELSPFTGIGLGDISNETTADDWQAMSETAAGKLTDGTDVAAQLEITDGSVKAEGLTPGMYLVVPEDTMNGDYSYEYQFTPYLTALPGNNYYSSGSDDWIYDATVGLKAEREMQYGALTINKTLTGYSGLTQEGYFVFDIYGAKDGKTYSNVASVTMTADGTQSAYIDGIPVGMEVTVREIYSGGSYEPSGTTEATVTILADQVAEVNGGGASVSFSNTYNDKLIPGTGVLNQFQAPGEDGGDWSWSQVSGNVAAE